MKVSGIRFTEHPVYIGVADVRVYLTGLLSVSTVVVTIRLINYHSLIFCLSLSHLSP